MQPCPSFHSVCFKGRIGPDERGFREFAGMIWTNDEASKLLGLFCEKDNPILTASQVKALFPPSFSTDCSNRRDIEEEIAMHWSYFLRDVEKGNLSITEIGGEPTCITLSDILAFATGAASIPPLGFEKEGRL